jgi:hypothetical protein
MRLRLFGSSPVLSALLVISIWGTSSDRLVLIHQK